MGTTRISPEDFEGMARVMTNYDGPSLDIAKRLMSVGPDNYIRYLTAFLNILKFLEFCSLAKFSINAPAVIAAAAREGLLEESLAVVALTEAIHTEQTDTHPLPVVLNCLFGNRD